MAEMAQRTATVFRGCIVVFLFAQCASILDKPQHATHTTPMHKVVLTQKGYIQFLRWELPVPELTEFTFCLWMESVDLTHPHSIFSYSKNEKERLVRAWIAPHGRSVHLEIGGTEVFAASTDIHENRWYHLCQSWENQAGRYALWVNGQLWVQGRSEETIGHVIPSKGDIVVGQEYTDFDKGLEDGIEGSVLGFNLILKSAFDPLNDHPRFGHAPIETFPRIPTKPMHRSIVYGASTIYRILPIRSFRTVRSMGGPLRFTSPSKAVRIENTGSRGRPSQRNQPLGLQLVQLTYVRCEIGRGSPFIGGSSMLISWTRTPVRIFGGAIVKNVRSKCGDF